MEEDLRTRIYGLNFVGFKRSLRIWERYPEQGEDYKIFRDRDAKVILDRADYYGMPDTNSHNKVNGERNGAILMWQMKNTPRAKKNEIPFCIYTTESKTNKPPRANNFADIVKELEKRSGTKGLTIVCMGI